MIQEWLLEDENPMIKYRLLTGYLGKNYEECKELYDSIWQQKNIVKILDKQDANGIWKNDYGSFSFTALRYLTVFAEYGLQKDARIDDYVNLTIKFLESYDEFNGCLAPLLLRTLVMLGYGSRQDIITLINRFFSAQIKDGGYICDRLLIKKLNRKSCYKASVGAIILYAECMKKNLAINKVDGLVEYFLGREVLYSNDKSITFYTNLLFPVEPMRIMFPITLEALSFLGYKNHPSLEKAFKLLKDKEVENGKLILEDTLSKQPCKFGKVGEVNKFVTYYYFMSKNI